MARPAGGVHSKSGPLPRGASAGGKVSPVDYARTLSGPAYREKGFEVSAPKGARLVPEYDAARDRNCPYTQTTKFKSHLVTLERAEAEERKQRADERRRQEARERGAAVVAGGFRRNAPGRSMSPEDPHATRSSKAGTLRSDARGGEQPVSGCERNTRYAVKLTMFCLLRACRHYACHCC